MSWANKSDASSGHGDGQRKARCSTYSPSIDLILRKFVIMFYDFMILWFFRSSFNWAQPKSNELEQNYEVDILTREVAALQFWAPVNTIFIIHSYNHP